MKLRRLAYLLILLPLLFAAIHSCSENRSTDYDLSNLKQITDLVKVDVVGTTAFPRVWFDTVNRFDDYAKATAGLASINPLDYWVETTAYGCIVTIVDSCAPDEFNEGDSCRDIALGTGIRAQAYVVSILDTIVCNYNIVDRSDSTITVKSVKFKEVQTAVAAKLEKNETQYRGWRIYAIGRQRQGFGFNLASFPVVDSIVLQSRSRDEVRATYFPTQPIQYVALSEALTLYGGEPLRITAYTRARFSNPPITDAYVHYSINGTFYHEWMGEDYSSDERFQIYEWDISESSGQQTGTYSQITVELFQRSTLRDTNPNSFANMLWAMTYRME